MFRKNSGANTDCCTYSVHFSLFNALCLMTCVHTISSFYKSILHTDITSTNNLIICGSNAIMQYLTYLVDSLYYMCNVDSCKCSPIMFSCVLQCSIVSNASCNKNGCLKCMEQLIPYLFLWNPFFHSECCIQVPIRTMEQ